MIVRRHLWVYATFSLVLAGCGSDSGAGTAASFEETLQTCTPGRFSTGVPGLGSADYIIEYPVAVDGVDGAGCSVTLVFTDNVNPAWVDQPLRMHEATSYLWGYLDAAGQVKWRASDFAQ